MPVARIGAEMAAMDNQPQTRLFVVDLVAQAALALCIGLTASIVLAGAVLLLAGAA
jgi:hypothetical protein